MAHERMRVNPRRRSTPPGTAAPAPEDSAPLCRSDSVTAACTGPFGMKDLCPERARCVADRPASAAPGGTAAPETLAAVST